MKFIIPKEYESTKIVRIIKEKNHKVKIDDVLECLFSQKEKPDGYLSELEIEACKWAIDILRGLEI